MVRVHAGIGMGGERLVPWLVGYHPADADAISDEHDRPFLEVADALRPTAGAAALLDDLRERDVPHVVATSAGPPERRALLRALGREDLDVLDEGDVASSKPAPDLLLAACDHLGCDPTEAVMVGDAPWDARAAARAGMPCILVRCGGFGDALLQEAAPTQLVDAPRDLVAQL